MAISVLQRNIAGNAASASSISLAFGSNTTAGSTIIVVASSGGGLSTIGPVSDTQNSGYKLVSTLSNVINFKCWVSEQTGASANTVTLTTGFNNSALSIWEVSGLAKINSFDKTAFAKQSSQTAMSSGNTATTSYVNELLLGIGADQNTTFLAYTLGSGYSNLQTVAVANNNTATEEQIVAATGAYAATFTLAANSTNEFTWILTFADTQVTSVKLPNTRLRPAIFKPGLAR